MVNINRIEIEIDPADETRSITEYLISWQRNSTWQDSWLLREPANADPLFEAARAHLELIGQPFTRFEAEYDLATVSFFRIPSLLAAVDEFVRISGEDLNETSFVKLISWILVRDVVTFT